MSDYIVRPTKERPVVTLPAGTRSIRVVGDRTVAETYRGEICRVKRLDSILVIDLAESVAPLFMN